jgi:hypothetical protein
MYTLCFDLIENLRILILFKSERKYKRVITRNIKNTNANWFQNWFLYRKRQRKNSEREPALRRMHFIIHVRVQSRTKKELVTKIEFYTNSLFFTTYSFVLECTFEGIKRDGEEGFILIFTIYSFRFACTYERTKYDTTHPKTSKTIEN